MKRFLVIFMSGEEETVLADRLWNDAGSVSFLNANSNGKWDTVRLIPLHNVADVQEV